MHYPPIQQDVPNQIRLSDGPNIKLVDLFKLVGTGLSLGFCLVIRGSIGDFLLLRYFSGIVAHHDVLQVSQYVSVESSSLTHQRFVYFLC